MAQTATLSGRYAGLPPGATIDLSAEGELDWAHWGLTAPTSFDHKDTFSPLLTDYIVLGGNAVQRTDGIGAAYSWGDGTPTASAVNTTTAVLLTGVSNGFQIQVPADSFPRRLKIYAGVYSAQAKLEAILSDGGANAYSDISLDIMSGESNRVYTIDFAAATAGHYLTVTFTVQASHDATLGSVRLHAAALQNNLPPIITLDSPTNETARAWPAHILFEATAEDFDVNGSIRKVEFFANNVLLAAVSNSPYTFHWTNAAVGAYAVTATATGADGEKASTDPITIFVYTNIGSLEASLAETPEIIDLTAEGVADWAHWGIFRETSYNHKAGVASQISNFRFVAYGPAYQFYVNSVGYTWHDGTPTGAATNSTSGVYLTDVGDGFEFTVPADTTLKTLRIYLGAFSARGKLQLYASDLSAAPVFDVSVQPAYGTANAVYTVNFRAGSTNQTLKVRYTVVQTFSTFGNITLQAATLTTGNSPPFTAITNVTAGSVFLSPTNLLIQATASDPDGTINKVEFFDGTNRLAELASIPYEFVWTNAPPGMHSLTTRATDNNGATFTSKAVDCFVSIGGGLLTGQFAVPPALADLSSAGSQDWAHWGLSLPTSFNHRAGITQQISSLTKIGDGQLRRFTGYATSFSWTDGTPTPNNPGSTAGVFLEGLGSGFKITVPADTTRRRLKLFLGIYAALGRLEVSLSDASAAAYVSSLSNLWNVAHGSYTLDYASASPNQTLTVTFRSADLFDVLYGNVTWEAAALALSELKLTNIQKSGSGFSFAFPTEPGESYAVEFTDALAPLNWTTLTNLVGDGTLALIFDDTATNAQRYYRVKAE